MVDEEFVYISKEIKRQFNILGKFDSSHDSKIGIFIGFIILALVQILTYEGLRDSFLSTFFSKLSFFVSLTIICSSFIFAMKAYSLKKYSLGPDVLPLIEDYRNSKEIDFDKTISRGIFDAKENNSAIMKQKIIYMKKMLNLFGIGFILLMLSFVTSLMGKWIV